MFQKFKRRARPRDIRSSKAGLTGMVRYFFLWALCPYTHGAVVATRSKHVRVLECVVPRNASQVANISLSSDMMKQGARLLIPDVYITSYVIEEHEQTGIKKRMGMIPFPAQSISSLFLPPK